MANSGFITTVAEKKAWAAGNGRRNTKIFLKYLLKFIKSRVRIVTNRENLIILMFFIREVASGTDFGNGAKMEAG